MAPRQDASFINLSSTLWIVENSSLFNNFKKIHKVYITATDRERKMSEDHIPIKNPTVDANDFKLGDFVYCISDVRPCYAVVIRISGIYVQFRHFENGFPDEDFRFLGQGSVRKASRDESLDHFHKISKRYEE